MEPHDDCNCDVPMRNDPKQDSQREGGHRNPGGGVSEGRSPVERDKKNREREEGQPKQA